MRTRFSEEILTVLYALYKIASGASSDRLCDCLDCAGIDYFTLHQILERQIESSNVFKAQGPNGELFLLSPSGKEAVLHFLPTVRASVRTEIDSYVAAHAADFRADSDIYSTVYISVEGYYTVVLKSFEGSLCLIDLTLTFTDRELAYSLAKAWSTKAPDIYQFIVQSVIS